MSAIQELMDKPINEMEAVERCIYIAVCDGYQAASYAEQAAAELSAYRALVETARSIEFDEVSGDCLLSCGGDSVSGHKADCLYLPVAAALARLEKAGQA